MPGQSLIKDPNVSGGWRVYRGGGTYTPSVVVDPDPPASDSDALRRALPDAQWGTIQTDAFGQKARYWPDKHINCGLLPSYGYAGRGRLTTIGSTTTTTAYSVTNATPVIIENRKFLGRVVITGQNYIFRNCWFAWNGAGTTAHSALVYMANYNVENIVFEDCLFEPDTPSPAAAMCIQGHGFIAKRCVFRRTEDGIDPVCSSTTNAAGATIYKTDWNIRVIGSWIGDLAFWSPDPTRAPADNESHNDCIQPNGGHDVWWQGCVIRGYYDPAVGNASEPSVDGFDSSGNPIHISGNKQYPNMQSTSVMMGTPINANTPIGDWHFERCYLSGGSYTFNLPVTTWDGDMFFVDCVFGKGTTRVGGGTSYIVAKTALIPRIRLSGNVLDDYDLNAATPFAGTPMTTIKTQ